MEAERDTRSDGDCDGARELLRMLSAARLPSAGDNMPPPPPTPPLSRMLQVATDARSLLGRMGEAAAAAGGDDVSTSMRENQSWKSE